MSYLPLFKGRSRSQPIREVKAISRARPNPIALSVVRLIGVEGTTLSVQGLDCLDGTPLIDIKPYFASTDAAPEAVVGHAARKE